MLEFVPLRLREETAWSSCTGERIKFYFTYIPWAEDVAGESNRTRRQIDHSAIMLPFSTKLDLMGLEHAV